MSSSGLDLASGGFFGFDVLADCRPARAERSLETVLALHRRSQQHPGDRPRPAGDGISTEEVRRRLAARRAAG